MNERARIAFLAARFGEPIGDDCALVGPYVWTIDAQVEGTHFRLEWLGWEDVGWRSYMAAASDLAAMGATPVAALSALSLTPAFDDLDALTRGQKAAAACVGAPIVGGNLARGTETSITTTVLGEAPRPVRRRGAAPGDGLYLGGDVGLAAAGLALLAAGLTDDVCVAAWRRPRAQIALGLSLRDRASAAIDVSDGLARDAGHLAEASGVALVLEAARLDPPPALREAAALLGKDAVAWMLGGGEDYALLATSAEPLAGFTRIGRVEAGAPAVLVEEPDGSRAPATAAGFDHFAGP